MFSAVASIIATLLEKLGLAWWKEREEKGTISVAEKEAENFAKPDSDPTDIISRL